MFNKLACYYKCSSHYTE